MTSYRQKSDWMDSLLQVSEHEQTEHRDLVLRHTDTVTELLAAEEYQNQRQTPCGCPHATPEVLAHSRGDDQWECVYERIETLKPSPEDCECGDPLVGSDDPLDTVAAVILSERDGLVERYFDTEERRIVVSLREHVGEWSEIAEYDADLLHFICEQVIPGRNIGRHRVERLLEALGALNDCSWFDEPSLRNIPNVRYDRIREVLADLPGVSDSDAWWLVLVALDKPVWPADPEIDRMLVELGLLTPDELTDGRERREKIEDMITPRQLLPLHRGLAAHVRQCSVDHADASCEFRRFSLSYRQERQALPSEGPAVADLFAGAGGLSHGFSRAGCQVTLAVDNDQYATDTYRLNHPEVPHERVRCDDISEIADDEELLGELESEVDIVVGGPPCQALSVAGYRARLSDDEEYSVLDDPRTELYEEYVSILEQLRPSFLVMENVEGILSEVGDTGCRVIEKVQEALNQAGYSSQAELLDCSQFDIPQDRQRVIVFGVRKDLFDEPDREVDQFFDDLASNHSSETVTIRQALANLPRIRRGEGAKITAGKSSGRVSRYVRENDLADDAQLTYNHRAREHPMDKDQELFDDVMEPGDTGWQVKYQKGRDDLIEYDVGTEDNPKFKDKYRMLNWNDSSPTIVAHLEKDANSFILPDYYQYVQVDSLRADDRRNRGITPREAARLQSFPDSYLFLGPFTSQFRQIGNAVPPILGEIISTEIQSQVAERMDALSQKDGDASVRSSPAATDD